MNVKNSAAVAALAGLALVFYSLWLWQPERQVARHHRQLLGAASHRNWTRFADLIGEKYSDHWGNDKAAVVSRTREILDQFYTLSLTGDPVDCVVDGNVGTVTAPIRMEGRGTPIADYAISEVNALREPFVFEWTRRSWKPWDWQLTRANHPQLQIPVE